MIEITNSRPIFIGGDGRSGTTLLSVILDSHPELAVGPELHFNGPPNLGPFMSDGIKLLNDGDERVTSQGIKKHPEYGPVVRFTTRAQRFGVDREELKRLIDDQIKLTNSNMELFEDRCHLINAMGSSVADRQGKSIWGMKVMREIKKIPRYAAVWPNAKFIHIVRDGRDVAASQVLEHSSWGYKDIDSAADKWASLSKKVRSFTNKFDVIEIRYEDLIVSPEKTLRDLLSFLEVSWNDSVLNHHNIEHSMFESGKSHPSFNAIKKPLNSKAVGRYKSDLSQEELVLFNTIAGEELIVRGYLP